MNNGIPCLKMICFLEMGNKKAAAKQCFAAAFYFWKATLSLAIRPNVRAKEWLRLGTVKG